MSASLHFAARRSPLIQRQVKALLAPASAWGSLLVPVLLPNVLFSAFTIRWAAWGRRLGSAGLGAPCLWASLASPPPSIPPAHPGLCGRALQGAAGAQRKHSLQAHAGAECREMPAWSGVGACARIRSLPPNTPSLPMFSSQNVTISVCLHKPGTRGSTLTPPPPSSPGELIAESCPFHLLNIPGAHPCPMCSPVLAGPLQGLLLGAFFPFASLQTNRVGMSGGEARV